MYILYRFNRRRFAKQILNARLWILSNYYVRITKYVHCKYGLR